MVEDVWVRMSASKSTCFVIMPFSKTAKHTARHWTEHFREYLKPLIEDIENVEARRSQPLRGNIVTEIIKDLYLSQVVVADLTDYNPNVFWELGIRQSFKDGTITIAEHGTRLPSDVAAKGTLFYHPKDATKDVSFQRRFKEAIQDCLTHPDRSDSIVLDTVLGRGSLFEIVHREESIRRLDALLEELDVDKVVRENVVEKAEAYQKDVSKRIIFPSDRYRLGATELLITHRYIEEPSDIYEVAGDYYRYLTAENEQLNFWKESPDLVERWLIDRKRVDDLGGMINDFRLKVKSARERLARWP